MEFWGFEKRFVVKGPAGFFDIGFPVKPLQPRTPLTSRPVVVAAPPRTPTPPPTRGYRDYVSKGQTPHHQLGILAQGGLSGLSTALAGTLLSGANKTGLAALQQLLAAMGPTTSPIVRLLVAAQTSAVNQQGSMITSKPSHLQAQSNLNVERVMQAHAGTTTNNSSPLKHIIHLLSQTPHDLPGAGAESVLAIAHETLGRMSAAEKHDVLQSTDKKIFEVMSKLVVLCTTVHDLKNLNVALAKAEAAFGKQPALQEVLLSAMATEGKIVDGEAAFSRALAKTSFQNRFDGSITPAQRTSLAATSLAATTAPEGPNLSTPQERYQMVLQNLSPKKYPVALRMFIATLVSLPTVALPKELQSADLQTFRLGLQRLLVTPLVFLGRDFASRAASLGQEHASRLLTSLAWASHFRANRTAFRESASILLVRLVQQMATKLTAKDDVLRQRLMNYLELVIFGEKQPLSARAEAISVMLDLSSGGQGKNNREEQRMLKGLLDVFAQLKKAGVRALSTYVSLLDKAWAHLNNVVANQHLSQALTWAEMAPADKATAVIRMAEQHIQDLTLAVKTQLATVAAERRDDLGRIPGSEVYVGIVSRVANDNRLGLAA